MTPEFIILTIIVVIGFTALFWTLVWRRKKPESESLVLLQNQMNEIVKTLDNRLNESTRAMQYQFGQSAKIVTDVTHRLTKLDETNRQVLTFSEQLQRLQDILKNPKQRGIYGEYSLELLLRNAFSPKQYKMQYEFSDGIKVDAAIFMGDKIIPVDSKFSLENYTRLLDTSDEQRRQEIEPIFKRDIKERIDETAKYIRPEEGTIDQAIMFISAEGLYYDLLVTEVGSVKVNRRDLVDYANKKRVQIASPTTLYMTLQQIWHTIRDQQLQESTKEILKNVENLRKHIQAYEDYMRKVGTQLQTTTSTYNTAYKELKKIDTDVLRLTGEKADIEPLLIEGPKSMEEEDIV